MAGYCEVISAVTDFDFSAIFLNETPYQFPIAAVKSYEIDAFFMGCYEYKTVWSPSTGEKFCGVMKSTNSIDKYAVAVQRNDSKVVGHLPLGKSEKFAKTLFYFLKADKKISLQNQCVWKGRKR